MTFEVREVSVQDGEPIELYTFQVYNELFRFTTAATDQIVDAQTYFSRGPISRSAPEVSGEIARNNLEIRTAAAFPMTEFYAGTPPSTVVLLTIARVHRGDDDPKPFWNGRVLSCKFEGVTASFHCENIFTSLRRTGLTRLYGRGCPYVLYGSDCRADELLFRQPRRVDGIAGAVLDVGKVDGTSEDFADGRLVGGSVTWEPVPGQVIRRGVVAHVGRSIAMTHAIEGLAFGNVVLVAPGCAHDLTDCDGFFDNVVNYGGLAPFLAGKNPFGQSSVF